MYYNKYVYKKIICATIVILFICSSSWAVTYYVDATNGNDSNAGTSEATSWKTIAKVNASRFNPGDQILFKRGEIWREQLIVPSSGNAEKPITFGAYGSGDKPIIDAADKVTSWKRVGENVWKSDVINETKQIFFNQTKGAIETSLLGLDTVKEWFWENRVLYIYSELDPTVVYTNPGIEASQRDQCVNINRKNYITLLNLKVKGANAQWRGNIDDYDASGLSSREGIVIKDCESLYAYNYGIRIDIDNIAGVLTGVNIYNNVVHHNGTGTNGFGILLQGTSGGSFADIEIHGNNTHGNREEGISFSDGTAEIYENYSYGDGLQRSAGIIIGPNTSNTKVYKNRVENPVLEGIWVHGNNDSGLEIYYNLLYGGAAFGIQIDQAGAGTKIYNNTIHNMNGGIAIGITSQSKGILINNNIIDALNDGSGNFESHNSSTYTSDYNCWDENKNFYPENVGKTWTEWKTLGFDQHSLYEDPHFIDPAGYNFALRGNSPCKDAGMNVGLNEDHIGNSVPMYNMPDMGAYEYKITPPKNLRIILIE